MHWLGRLLVVMNRACAASHPRRFRPPTARTHASILYSLIFIPSLDFMVIMSTSSTPPCDMDAFDSASSYFLCSTNSATETDSDVAGPGRLLGRLYDRIGEEIEDGLSTVADKLGYGPQALAVKIRRFTRIRGEGLVDLDDEEKLKKAGKRLVKYIRYAAPSNMDGMHCIHSYRGLTLHPPKTRLCAKFSS